MERVVARVAVDKQRDLDAEPGRAPAFRLPRGLCSARWRILAINAVQLGPLQSVEDFAQDSLRILQVWPPKQPVVLVASESRYSEAIFHPE